MLVTRPSSSIILIGAYPEPQSLSSLHKGGNRFKDATDECPHLFLGKPLPGRQIYRQTDRRR
jgi:hypothetical protein